MVHVTLWTLLLFGLVPGSEQPVLAASLKDISWDIDATSRFVGDSAISGADAHIDSFDAFSTDLKFALSPQLSPNLLLRLGAEWERLSFDVPERVSVPPVLQKVSAIIGLDYQLTDEWLLRADVQPGIYSDFHDISERDLDAPFLLGAAYLVNADLQWFFGVRVDPRSRYPALPAVGVRWRFADEWTLNLLLPNPRLEWDLNDRWKAYLGISVDRGAFTVGDHFGSDRGRPDLNGATLDYSEIRIGPGISWRIGHHFTVEAEAGCMAYRRFDFFHEHLSPHSHPAPYVQIGAHIQF